MSEESAKQALGELLGRIARVYLDDGRVIAGSLACVDYVSNIILLEAVELRSAQTPQVLESEELPALSPLNGGVIVLGDVMVPGGHVLDLEVLEA